MDAAGFSVTSGGTFPNRVAHEFDTPGPGSYDPPPLGCKGPKFPGGVRFDRFYTDYTPGPGAYRPHTDNSIGRGPKFSF